MSDGVCDSVSDNVCDGVSVGEGCEISHDEHENPSSKSASATSGGCG